MERRRRASAGAERAIPEALLRERQHCGAKSVFRCRIEINSEFLPVAASVINFELMTVTDQGERRAESARDRSLLAVVAEGHVDEAAAGYLDAVV